MPGAREDPRVGLSGDAHALGRRVLVEPFRVRESDGLELVEANRDCVGFARGLSDGAEAPALQVAADATREHGTRHLFRAYAHNDRLSTTDLAVALAPSRDLTASV